MQDAVIHVSWRCAAMIRCQRSDDAAGARPAPRIPRAGGRERRENERLPLRLPLSYRAVAAHPPVQRHATTLDVSGSGVRMRLPDFIPQGAFLAVEIALPRRTPHLSRVRMVWVREMRGGEGWEAGAEFLRAEGGGDAALNEVLALGA
jgi:hypothetical protein